MTIYSRALLNECFSIWRSVGIHVLFNHCFMGGFYTYATGCGIFFIKVFIFFDISILDTYLEKKRNNF